MRHDGNPRLGEIEAEISRTRNDMDATLSAIEERLTPGQLIDQGLDYLRHNGAKEFASNLGASVRDNPLPVALVGLGVSWLMLSGQQQRPAAATDRIAQAGASAKDSMAQTLRSAGDRLSSASETARTRVSQAAETARHQVQRARRGYDYVRREQPLALGVIGLAIGAALAFALPRTRHEDEWMGEASDRFSEGMKEAGREQFERVQGAATAARDAAAEKFETASSASSEHPVEAFAGRSEAAADGGSADRRGR